MCGILGQINIDKVEVNEHNFKDALLSQKNRGPDKTNYYFNQNIALGHVRLSIIDVDGGHQPLKIDDYVIIFNGEIYNHNALRKELELSGVQFETRSDTEVVYEAYINWGMKCFEKFLGIISNRVLSSPNLE